MLRLALPAVAFCFVAACSSTSSAPPGTVPPADAGVQDAPAFVPPPASTVVEDPGSVAIRREVLVVDGVVPPPNPLKNAATPPEQNKVRVVRYRVDADPPKPARAIFVMMPGFLAGAGAFDAIARAIVRRSTATDSFEAWAIDRRANFLEDTFGLDVAEVMQDPSIAHSYYFDQNPVLGQSFAGFLDGAALPWTSEWGLATTVGDLRNVITKVPQADRAQRVILFGHSLGAAIAEEYAAWDFGGQPGYADIAGLALLDGVAGNEGKAAPFDQPTYENGDPDAGGLGAQLGVNSDIRNGNTFFALPFLGVKAYVVSEYTAMRARWTGTLVEADTTRDDLLGVTLGLSPLPKMTDRAAFGFAFDENSAPFPFVAVSCGEGNGGAITPYESALSGMKLHPSDPTATYGWTEYDMTVPKENTSIDDFARAWYEGPGLNLAEWYFAQRLTVDVQAASTLNVTAADWRASSYGLLAEHGPDIDVPILAVALALEQTSSVFDALQATVKTPAASFSTMALPQLQHVDGVAGADDPGSAVKQWYDALVAFGLASTPAGGTSVVF
jgi:hypothetical protein